MHVGYRYGLRYDAHSGLLLERSVRGVEAWSVVAYADDGDALLAVYVDGQLFVSVPSLQSVYDGVLGEYLQEHRRHVHLLTVYVGCNVDVPHEVAA